MTQGTHQALLFDAVSVLKEESVHLREEQNKQKLMLEAVLQQLSNLATSYEQLTIQNNKKNGGNGEGSSNTKAGYMDPEFRRQQHGYVPNTYPHHHQHSHPQDMHEAILREIEKERIREEIIMSEIVRRRVLEAEVRRELTMEREMALQRVTDGFPSGSSPVMSEIVRSHVLEAEVRRDLMMEREMALQRGRDGFPSGSSPVMELESPIKPSSLVTRAEEWSAEEGLGTTLEDKEMLKGRDENGGLKTSPFQRVAADLRFSEVNPPSEGNKEKERIFLLTKQDDNVSGSMMKDVTPPKMVNIELPADVIANKKSKEEWSCALCQFSATSEKGLSGHLLGMKHKSKVAMLRAQRAGKRHRIGLFPKKIAQRAGRNYGIGLLPKKRVQSAGKNYRIGLFPKMRSQKAGKNYGIGPFPKNATKSNPVVGTEEEGVKLEAQSLFSEKAGKATSKDNLPLLENPKSEHLKKTQAEEIHKVHNNEDDPKKKNFRFWCEMCLVGTLSSEDMNSHKRGNKHVSRLRRCEQNGGTGSSFYEKKSVVLVDPVEEISENGKNENLEKFNQAMDEASSENHTLLDAVKHEEQHGKTLNSENINKVLDEVRSKDHELLDAVQEDHKRVDIIMEEDIRQLILPSQELVILVPSDVGKTKTDVNVSGSSKVVNIELPADVITYKKSKEEWSCALCQVSTTSENCLNGHLLGKKHKSTVAALSAQRAEINDGIGFFPQKDIKSNPVGTEFWREMCHVGTLSSEEMNSHKWGNKHVSWLRRYEQNGGTGSFNQKKSAVLVDPVEEVSENGKNENLEKFKLAVDEASSKNHTLLDAVKHEEQEGKTLNFENINKAFDEPRFKDHELLDAVEHEDHKRVDIITEEDMGEWILRSQKLVISVSSDVGKTETDDNVSGSSRKAVTPPKVVNIELPADVIANKKSKEEWSCALCQVGVSSEKGLNEHVLGKKHKSNEAALRAQRAGENDGIGLFPTGPLMQSQPGVAGPVMGVGGPAPGMMQPQISRPPQISVPPMFYPPQPQVVRPPTMPPLAGFHVRPGMPGAPMPPTPQQFRPGGPPGQFAPPPQFGQSPPMMTPPQMMWVSPPPWPPRPGVLGPPPPGMPQRPGMPPPPGGKVPMFAPSRPGMPLPPNAHQNQQQ